MVFSYKELTSVQVQGAGDRARRQVEVARLASHHGQIQKKWHNQFLTFYQLKKTGSNDINNTYPFIDNEEKTTEEEEEDMNNNIELLFTDAIKEAFENERNREVSPFMTARLASLSCREYKTILADKGLRRLHNDYRVVINWLYEQMETLEKDKVYIQSSSTDLVEKKKQELQALEERKIQELRETLEWKKRELAMLKEQQNKKLEQLKQQQRRQQQQLQQQQQQQQQRLEPQQQQQLQEEQHLRGEQKLNTPLNVLRQQHFRSSKPTLERQLSTPDTSEGSDWIDLDDGFEGSGGSSTEEGGGGSDWIVCS